MIQVAEESVVGAGVRRAGEIERQFRAPQMLPRWHAAQARSPLSCSHPRERHRQPALSSPGGSSRNDQRPCDRTSKWGLRTGAASRAIRRVEHKSERASDPAYLKDLFG